jgi:hypothetical protein
MEDHLFEIKLEANGKYVLQRINKLGKFIFTCSLIIAIFDLISSYVSFRGYVFTAYSAPAILKFETIIGIIYLLLYMLVLPFHGYFFYRYSQASKKALRFESSEEFNQSFNDLHKYVLAVCVLLAINVIFGGAIVYSQIKLAMLYKI